MSSGASKRNEKPRAGSSSCIDDSPRSSRIPSTLFHPSAEAWKVISAKVACRRCARPPNDSRLAAPTQGPVDIVAPRPRFQGGEDLLVKYRGVLRSRARVGERRAHGLPRGKVESRKALGVGLGVGHAALFPGPDGGAPDFEVLPGTNKDGLV